MDWDWVQETALDIGGTFTFARGASPEQVMTAFGMNPARALLVPASDFAQALHDPDWLRTEPPEHPWIRVGVAGEWGFALDESMAGSGGYEDAAVSALAAGTEVVLFTHTQTIDDFRYYADGTLVTMFEPLRGSDRYGTEPDRFVEQMRQVGLPANAGDQHAANPVIALLQMLTVTLGIWVPRDLALGPLLTVQRETPLPLLPAGAPAGAQPAAVRAERIRPRLQRLLASGVTADAIAARTQPRMSPKSNRRHSQGREDHDPRQDRRADTRHASATQRVILSAHWRQAERPPRPPPGVRRALRPPPGTASGNVAGPRGARPPPDEPEVVRGDCR